MDDQQGRRRIVFVTGTRADFGKLKPLMHAAEHVSNLEVFVFVTGMHMFQRYGFTWMEVVKEGFSNIHPFVNQSASDSSATVLGKTILGFNDYLAEVEPDVVVIHGDRLEALACASAAVLLGVRVAHVEGGEISGTVDEALRHAVSKLSHIHLVSNSTATRLLEQLGEVPESIFNIGSPEVDVMLSDNLPRIESVIEHYELPAREFGVVIFHPASTDTDEVYSQALSVVEAVNASQRSHVVIFPNNDPGSERIFEAYRGFEGNPLIRLLPSMRFEYYLAALRHSLYILGNSSSGIREAPAFGVPSINVGSRQDGRLRASSTIDVPAEVNAIKKGIETAMSCSRNATPLYGQGGSADSFTELLRGQHFWNVSTQKKIRVLPT